MKPLWLLYSLNDEIRFLGKNERKHLKENCIAKCIGVGNDSAERAMEALLAQTGELPRLVILTGFCGALDPELAPGALVEEQGNFAAGEAEEPVERFLCSQDVVASADGKRVLWQSHQHQLAAVDMETGAIRKFCRRHHLRYHVVKAVLDEADWEIPVPSSCLYDMARQRVPLERLLLHLAVRPRKLPALLELASRSRQAGLALAGRLDEVLAAGYGILR